MLCRGFVYFFAKMDDDTSLFMSTVGLDKTAFHIFKIIKYGQVFSFTMIFYLLIIF